MKTENADIVKVKITSFWAWKLTNGKWLGFDPKHPDTTDIFRTSRFTTEKAAKPFSAIVSNIVESGKALNMNFTEKQVNRFLNLTPDKLVFVRVYAEYRDTDEPRPVRRRSARPVC